MILSYFCILDWFGSILVRFWVRFGSGFGLVLSWFGSGLGLVLKIGLVSRQASLWLNIYIYEFVYVDESQDVNL